MGDTHVVLMALQVTPGRLGDGDAAMLTASASDRDGESRLALGDIPGHDGIEQAEPGVEELVRLGDGRSRSWRPSHQDR